MNISTKLLQAAAGSAGGAGLDVDEVFSTFLFTGTGSGTSTIANGIDLSGEGGLVWIKSRTGTSGEPHFLVDTERGGSSVLQSNSTAAPSNFIGSPNFLSNGFSGTSNINDAQDYASWTFRKAPKFFDVVTYTGNGVAGRTVSHSLGSVPGMIIVKKTNSSEFWYVAHRSINADEVLYLNSTSAKATQSAYFNGDRPTDSVFTLGNSTATNGNGATYVAYLFAHNNNDGEFGPDSDQDIIKCGSYTGNSTIGHTINLGFEAQWVLVRSTSDLRKWMLYDVMRGMPVDGNGAALYPNSTDDEEALARIGASNVGFQLTSTDSMVNVSGETYIYMAIRRGPLAAPDDATKVFTPVLGDGSGTPSIKTNHITDFGIAQNITGGGTVVGTRLLGTKQLKTHTNGAEATNSYFNWDFQNGWHTWTGLNTNYINWNWKRAPGYFDCVAFSGTGSARTVPHGLTVPPEMIWCKQRSGTKEWRVYHKDLDSSAPEDYYLVLNSTNARVDNADTWNDTAPTSSVFSVGSSSVTNQSGQTFIAYLFATVAGVSKVGSVSHTSGSATNVSCGFSNGARFIILKRYDAVSDWWVFDTVRGIAVGNDARLYLNSTNAETSTDQIDPLSSGFTIDGNRATGDYIFYAIA